MDFHQRFKGKTSIMDKEGIDGIVKSKALPIEIYTQQGRNNTQQQQQSSHAGFDHLTASPMKSILLDTAKQGLKQKTKIFTNITRGQDNTNSSSVSYFPHINQQLQQLGQSPSSSSTASSSSQFTRGRHDFTKQIHQQQQQQQQFGANMKLIQCQVQNVIPLDKLQSRNGVLSTKQFQEQIKSQAVFQIERVSSIKNRPNNKGGKINSEALAQSNSIININKSETLNSNNSLSHRQIIPQSSQTNQVISTSQEGKYKGNALMNRSSIITDRGVHYSLDNKSIQKSIPSIHNHLSQTMQPHNSSSNSNGNNPRSNQQNASISYQYNSSSNFINDNLRLSGTQSSKGYFPSYSTVSLTGSYKLPPGLNNIVVPSDYDLIAVPKALSQTQALPINYFNRNQASNSDSFKNQQDSLAALMFATDTKQRNTPHRQQQQQQRQIESDSFQQLSQMYQSLQSADKSSSAAEKLSLLNAAKNVLEQTKPQPQGIGGGAFRYELDLMEEKHRDIIGNLDRIRQKRTKK